MADDGPFIPTNQGLVTQGKTHEDGDLSRYHTWQEICVWRSYGERRVRWDNKVLLYWGILSSGKHRQCWWHQRCGEHRASHLVPLLSLLLTCGIHSLYKIDLLTALKLSNVDWKNRVVYLHLLYLGQFSAISVLCFVFSMIFCAKEIFWLVGCWSWLRVEANNWCLSEWTAW